MFPEAFQRTVTDYQALLIVHKLARHFKIGKFRVWFYGSRGNGSSYGWGIRLSHNSSVGLICHEVAHEYNGRKYGDSAHNKKLLHTLKRLISYCQKQNYWQHEFAKREEKKAIKPQPTKKEIIEKKRRKVQNHIKRIETRIKRLNTSLKKWKRKEKYYQKQLSFG